MDFITKDKFRKVLSLLLTLALLAGSITANVTPVMADDNPALTVGSVSGAAGASISVPVTLTSNGDVCGVQFDLSFNNSLLTYSKTTRGTLISTTNEDSEYIYTITPNALSDNSTRVMVYSATNTVLPSGSGIIANLKFTVNSGAAGGQSCTLALSGVKLVDVNSTTLTTNSTDGTFSTPSIAVTGVSLDKTTDTITVGATSQLTATVVPDNATNKNVTWTSDNTTVATVSSSGLVTGAAVGTDNITVTTADGSFTATCAVTVSPTAVTGVSLNKTTDTLAVGGTDTLTATVSPTAATNQAVTWTSDNTDAATVSSSGLVTAVGAGTANITVTTADGGFTATCAVTVTEGPGTLNIVACLPGYASGVTITLGSTPGTGNGFVYKTGSSAVSGLTSGATVSDGTIYSATGVQNITTATAGNYVTIYEINSTSYAVVNYVCRQITSSDLTGTTIGDYYVYLNTTNNTATIIKYTNTTATTLTIASTLTSSSTVYNVTAIANGTGTSSGAFYGARSVLTSVTIPDNITSIGNYAFRAFTKLTSLTMGSGVTSIGNYAFYGCTGLTSISLPSGVTSIGSYAFNGCTGLTSISLPSGVTSIGSYAFNGCTGLTSISLSSGLTSIGSYAFYSCTGLTSLTVPASVASIDSNAFSNCTKLAYACFQGAKPTMGTTVFASTASGFTIYYYASQAASWSGYTDYSIAVYHEATLDPNYSGSSTTVILAQVDSSSHLIFPSYIPTRDNYTFNGWYKDSACTDDWDFATDTVSEDFTLYAGWASGTAPGRLSITTAAASSTFGRTVITLGSTAGSGNSLVYKVSTIPAVSGLTTTSTITDGTAFVSGSTAVPVTAGKYVTIYEITAANNVVNYIYRQIFASEIGSSLTQDSLTYVLSNGTFCVNTYSGSGGAVVIPGTLTIDGTTYAVTAMKEGTSTSTGLFSAKTAVTSVTIPDNMTNIGAYTFYNCTGLTSVTLGTGITSIGNYAFFGCSNAAFTSITLPSGLKSIGSYGFYGCTKLTSITLPDGVSSLGEYAFGGCSGLTSATLGNSITSIGKQVFYNCTGLISVTSPSTVTSIGEKAFYGCTVLTTVDLYNGLTSIGANAFYGCKGLTSITIPSSITAIGESAFYGCTSLTEATLKSGVTYGSSVYQSCTGLTSVTIENGVTKTPDYIFGSCNKIPSIIIPNSVTSIGTGSFYCCASLTSVTIPASVTTIGNYSFSNCTLLNSVTLPESVTSIGNGAFMVCVKLTSATIRSGVTYGTDVYNTCTGLTSDNVTIENGVTTIPTDTFYGCTGLTSITIPASVTSIGIEAFRGCTKLTAATLKSGVTYGSGVFRACTGLTSDNITIESGVNALPNNTFYGCTGLTSIPTFPNSMTAIGDSAFYGCTGLTAVMLESGLTYGTGVYYNCTGLTSATIESGVIAIPSQTFVSCTGLTTVTIPSSVTSIGDSAFQGCAGLTTATLKNGTSYGASVYGYCTGLTSVTVESGVTTIPSSTFIGCTKLTSVAIPASVTSVATSAFYGCSSLTSAFFAGSVPTATAWSNIFQNASSSFTLYYHISQASSWSSFSYYTTASYIVLTLDPNYYGSTVTTKNAPVTSGYITAPDDPVRDGRVFDSWYKEAACTNLWSFAGDTVTGDITLYAGWTTYTATVSAGISGGTVAVNPSSGVAGDKITVTVTPEAGKQLIEDSLKYTTDNGTTYTTITATEGIYSFVLPAADVIITAQFETADCTVTFQAEGAEVYVNDVWVADYTVEYGQSLTFTVQPDEGMEVASVTGDETDLTPNIDGSYTLDNVSGNILVEISVQEAPATISVTGVTLNKTTDTLTVGGSDQLTANVTPENATNTNVSWSSNDSDIATVSSTGLVTAMAGGSATITVTTEDGSYTDSCTVTVNNYINLSLSPSTCSVAAGQTFDVDIEVQNGNQKTAGIDAYLDFDPAKLMVVDMDNATSGVQITNGNTLTTDIQNSANNTDGYIKYSAGVLGSAYPTSTFSLATIRFKALAETSTDTAVTFSTSYERPTTVVNDNDTDVTGTLTGGAYEITAGLDMDVAVVLQGSGRPDSAWIVPLTVKFFTPGASVLTAAPLYTFTNNSTRDGSTAVITCTNIPLGAYDISAVSSHTLVNVKKDVVVDSSTESLSLGTLLEGNANNDVRVNISDFGVLSKAYGSSSTDSLYNAMADFDGSGAINISDFSLLSSNYALISPVTTP